MSYASPYRGTSISLLTQHGKEQVLGPLFAASLEARLELATGFDTDTLGTFTREIPRAGTQLEAARRKAHKGMELTGLTCGVASEGAFGPGPFGLLPMNLELVVLVDRARRIEIVGRAQGPSMHRHERVATEEALREFAGRVSFPDHGLVLRPDDQDDPRVRKGLADWPALLRAFAEARAESRTGAVFVETDLRAHHNPTRREVIRAATEDLIARIRTECPRCASPGFGLIERLPGLPCLACASPTDDVLAERWGCVTGDHFEIRDHSTGRFADPCRCDTCNP